MVEWRESTVADCLERVALAQRRRIPRGEYKSTGRFPVVDQGQGVVAGWTDDESAIINTSLPVVLFGDHTRTVKYLDFPFARGADGTQILRPVKGIDAKFFYFAIQGIEIPSRGYNRHFQLLREASIRVPGESEQSEIALVLTHVESAMQKQDVLLRAAQRLLRATTNHLFTRGLHGKAQKQSEVGPIPESWVLSSLGELCEISSGGTPAKSTPEYWGGDIPWVSGKDLKLPVLDDAIDHVTDAGVAAGSRLAPAGAVLLLVRGMGLAKDLPVAAITRPMAFNQDVKALVPKSLLGGNYIRAAIYAGKERLLGRIVSSAHGTMTLNLDDVASMLIPVPPLEEASEIVCILDALEAKVALHRRKRAVLDQLFKSLLHKLLTGEIRVADLSLDALAGVPATERAAS